MEEKFNILVVDDEEMICQAVTAYFTANGYTVFAADSGKKAVDVFSTEKIDFVILDLMLPEMTGEEVCEHLRTVSSVPILMLTAKTGDDDIVNGLNIGADDYMTKPFSPSELVARVKAHLSRYERLINSSQPENDIIEIRGIKIDKTARRVFVNGEEKIFTTKEFDLLTFLAEHPNHVYTKEELFKEIWDMDSIGDIATVTVHI